VSVDVEEGERSRENSIFRKLSAISTRSIGREQQDNKDQGPLTLKQVTSLLAFQVNFNQLFFKGLITIYNGTL